MLIISSVCRQGFLSVFENHSSPYNAALTNCTRSFVWPDVARSILFACPNGQVLLNSVHFYSHFFLADIIQNRE